MRAIRYHEFGGPEVLRLDEVPEPHPAANQIRVVVNAAGVNPVDWKLRSGAMGGEIPPGGRPIGVEAAGVVDEVGDAVSDVTAGDEVFGSAIGGAAADFTLMENYAHIPATIDFVTAAGLTVAAETAARVLDLLGITDGQTLLVNGASGAVGLATIQLARHRGIRVIGTAGSVNQELVREFGAVPTTYGDGLSERVRELAPDGIDGVLDAGPGGPRSAIPELVELAGGAERVVAIADYAGAEQAGVRFTGGPGDARAWYVLDQLGPLIESGEFRLPLARTFELDEIADAHRLGESGQARGKIVLTVD
jgi:NADPH:quinone reductase-like Zn-dependent oxidoreductase